MSCRDLGIIVTNDLSPSEHVNNVTVKAHQRANAILPCFASRVNKLLIRAFTTYIRQLLEYNSVIIWSPYLKQDFRDVQNPILAVSRLWWTYFPTDRHKNLN